MSNPIIFLVQFGINKHLHEPVFYLSLKMFYLYLFYSKLHSKSCDYVMYTNYLAVTNLRYHNSVYLLVNDSSACLIEFVTNSTIFLLQSQMNFTSEMKTSFTSS